MSIISFFEVDFSFDLNYLQKLISEVHQLLKEIVRNHLTEKSMNKIDEIFDFFNNPQFLESIFKADSPHRDVMGQIVSDLNKIMEQNECRGDKDTRTRLLFILPINLTLRIFRFCFLSSLLRLVKSYLNI
jgi:Domain of unknown function (DUF758)